MVGVVLAVAAALCLAVNNIALHKGFRHDGNPETAMLVNNLVGTVMFVGAFLVSWRLSGPPPFSWTGIALFALAGFLMMVLGRFFDMWGVQLLGPSRAASARLSEPGISYLVSLVLLHEALALSALAGIGLVMLALQLLMHDVRRERAAQREGAPSALGLLVAMGAGISLMSGHAVRRMGLGWLPSPLLGITVAYLVSNVFYAAGALIPYVRRRMFGADWSNRGQMVPFILSGVFGGLGNYLLFEAVRVLPVAVVITLRHTAPWWTIALGYLFLRGERVNSRWVVCSAAVGLAGVWLILSA